MRIAAEYVKAVYIYYNCMKLYMKLIITALHSEFTIPELVPSVSQSVSHSRIESSSTCI